MMKMKKKRRLIKKINPSVLFTVDKEKLDLSETKMKPLSAKGNMFINILTIGRLFSIT